MQRTTSVTLGLLFVAAVAAAMVVGGGAPTHPRNRGTGTARPLICLGQAERQRRAGTER